MTRWTTKTANSYFNQYGYQVSQKQSGDNKGRWYLDSGNAHICSARTLTELVAQGRDELLQLIPDGSCTELACPVDYEHPVVVAEFAITLQESLTNPEYRFDGNILYHINGQKVGSFTRKRCQYLFNPFTSSANNNHLSWLDAINAAITWFEKYHLEADVALEPEKTEVDGVFYTVDTLVNGYQYQVTQLGWFNEATVARSCSVTYHYSPIDEFGYQEVICCSDSTVEETDTSFKEQLINTWSGRLTETDDNIPSTQSYLTEEEYQRDKHLMEF